MSTPVEGPSRSRYVVAAVLLGIAVVIVAVLGTIFVRAIVGYDIEPIEPDSPTSITVGDRGVTLWSASELDPGSCTASLSSGNGSELQTSSTSLTYSTGTTDWTRVGTLHAEPGSTYDVRCTGGSSDQHFGYAPTPRIGHYVVLGSIGGGAAVLLTIAAFVVWLVTLLGRQKAAKSARAAQWPQPPPPPPIVRS